MNAQDVRSKKCIRACGSKKSCNLLCKLSFRGEKLPFLFGDERILLGKPFVLRRDDVGILFTVGFAAKPA